MFEKILLEFIHLFGELLGLFVIISFLVALMQIYISPAKMQKLLTTPNRILNSALGASLGAITPFCSCSTIPMLTGLLKSGAPFCGTVSFLLTSPILNPAVITLLIAFFGLRAAAIYAVFTLSLAIVMGLLLDKLGFEKEIKPLIQKKCACEMSDAVISSFEGKFLQKHVAAIKMAAKNSAALFKNIFPYLLIGAGLGSFIHGFVPEGLFENFAGANQFWAIPVAAVSGIPMYIRTESMIPIASVLMSKGVAPGVVIALILGGAGASLPELSLLSSIFKKKMIFAFVTCVFAVAITTGFIFNMVL